jgi:paraquat-inducible protein B
MEPGAGKQTTHFQGISHKPLAPMGGGTPSEYTVLFDGAVGDLEQGDPIKLRGFTVGEVENIGFQLDAATGTLRTPVTIGLFPSSFHLQPDPAHKQQPLRAAVTTLIDKGLRAQLERNPPFIGSYGIALEMVPNAPAATASDANGLPQIPTAPGGGLDSIVTRINKVPIDQIAQNVDDITHRVDGIVASPKLGDAVSQLESAVAQLHETIAHAGPQVTQLVDTLRNASDQLDQVAKSADKVVGGPGTQTGVRSTMRKVAQAATSIRELADYLDRHPEALIHGRSGD